MQFIDFFAGIGGMRYGLEQAGHKCMGFCEFDKYAVASYTSMYLITDEQRKYLGTLDLKKRQKEILKDEYRNGEWYADDVRNVHARDIPDGTNCYTFGAPCQDFSVAGHRAGLAGDRSSLVREIFRIVEEQEEQDRPEWLIYENVKGMLSSNHGLDFLSIILEMDRLGYDIQWQNINSAWYVPQNRERIYTVGHLRRYGPAKVFPLEATDGENSVSIIGHKEGYRRNMQVFSPDGITEALDTGAGGGRGHHVAEPCFCDICRNEQDFCTTNIAHTLLARDYKGMPNRPHQQSGVAIPIQIKDDFKLDGNNYNQRKTVNGNGNPSRTIIGGGHSGNEPKVAIPVLTPDRAEKRQNGRRMKEDGDTSFTLTAEDRHGVAISLEPIGGARSGMSKEFYKNKDNITENLSRTVTAEGDNAAVLKVKEPQNDVPDDEHPPKYIELEDGVTAYAIWYEKYQCYITIRKLTPKECFRLQGFPDELFDKAQFVNSDSQLYKQAGNAVTVNVARAVGERIKEVSDEQ